MFYDYLLTAESEVELVWLRKMSPSSWILLANRAVLWLSVVSSVVGYANTTVCALANFLTSLVY